MDDRVKKAMVRMRCDSWRWNGVKEIYEDCREDALIIEGELSRLTRENERLLSTAGGTEYARAEKAESERDALRATVAELVVAYAHTHKSKYKTVGDQNILTDECDKCGFDIRHVIHSTFPPEPEKQEK